LSRGGQQVNTCANTFNKALKLLVELASLQVTLTRLYVEVKTLFCKTKEQKLPTKLFNYLRFSYFANVIHKINSHSHNII